MRVLVCGDRNWTDMPIIANTIAQLAGRERLHVIHGAARGADSLAAWCAENVWLCPVTAYPAQWDRYHNGAGPTRNQQMIDEGHPDVVVAFHADISQSKGTSDMLTRAEHAGIPYALVDGRG